MGRTVKQPEVRRQEILKAALDLFCEKGYEGASIADLARRLGISQGLCYRYFPSKRALLDCAVDQYAQQQADPAYAPPQPQGQAYPQAGGVNPLTGQPW